MRRGEVHWFDADPVRGSEQAGRRPALVISRDAVNQASPVVVVLPITTWRRQRLYPSDTLVRSGEAGLTVDSVVLGLQIRAIDRARLTGRLGQVSAATLCRVEDALLKLLDIER